jgi:hypothetical protein
LWYKITAVIGGTVAGNKRRLSKREFNGWAEYFDYDFNQYQKLELYLARILNVLYGLAGAEIPMNECYIPVLNQELNSDRLNADEAAAMLKGMFNNG